MAIYKKDTPINTRRNYREFCPYEIGKYVTPEVIENLELKMFEAPKIAFKVELSSYNRNKIDVLRCKSLGKDIIPPSDKEILEISEIFADEAKTINVWLGINGMPYFISSADGAKLIDMTLYEKAEPMTIEFLKEMSLSKKDKDIENYYVVSSEADVYYLRDKNGLSKLFIPHMLEWFDKYFPGLMVADEHENGTKISKLGFRILLQMFILETWAFVNTAPETFSPQHKFTVAIPELIDSVLGGGLKLAERQTKQLEKMSSLKTSLSPIDRSFFPDNIISNPHDLEDEVSFNEHMKCTWHVFLTNLDFFPIGCDVYLAPNEVIVDKNSNLIFSDSDVLKIIYHGKSFVLPEKADTVDIVVRGNIVDNDLRARIAKYFNEYLDLTLHTIRTENATHGDE